MSAPRILVVDDEPQIVRGLKIILRSAGYTVEAAETKAQALALLASRPPDALVLDLVLPDGQGVEVCREVRGWSRLPILVLSAVGDEREKVRALDAGADDYITKPFGSDELLARLRAVLRRSAEAGGSPRIELGELVIDLADRRIVARRRGGASDADRVRARPRARPASRPPGHPPPAAAGGMGAGVRRPRPTTSGCTSPTSGPSSRPIPPARSTSSPSRVSVTGCASRRGSPHHQRGALA